MIMHCASHVLDLTAPKIMGILNVTPDSFSDGGVCYSAGRVDLDRVLQNAEKMLSDGADIIDVGGESTRPGALPVSEQEELDRVIPVVELLVDRLGALVSVDTSRSSVISIAANKGAGMINDVRALSQEGAMVAAAKSGLPVCLMHMQGQPQTMQRSPEYIDVVDEVATFLRTKISECVAQGIDASRIVIDPGFGFGKTQAHNLELLARLSELKQLGLPMLVGLSRKSLLGSLLGREVGERLPGSLALALMAVEQGASILRVHDVAATKDVLTVYGAVKNIQ
jgi:dihydropteroate synthase